MKHLGLLSILICWAGLIFLIRKWKGNPSMTFSQHAAQYKSSALFYMVLFALCLPFFYWFIMSWFVPEFHLGSLFKLLITVCSLSLLVAAIIPETEGNKATIHRYAAFTMAYFMFPVVALIALSSHFSAPTRTIATIFTAGMFAAILLLLKHKRRHPRMLYIQGGYVAAFHLTIIAATYLR